MDISRLLSYRRLIQAKLRWDFPLRNSVFTVVETVEYSEIIFHSFRRSETGICYIRHETTRTRVQNKTCSNNIGKSMNTQEETLPNQSKTYLSAVIFARVSSESDRQNTDRQIAELMDYAGRNRLNVEKVFSEHISGAKKNEERPTLCQCLEYCKTHAIHTLLINALDRLGRNVDEVLANVKYCKDNNINIYFQKENLNIFQPDGTKNPFLNIFISVLGTCAELERSSIAYRLATGRKRYVENGGKLGRKSGYRKSHERKMEEYRDIISYLHKGYPVRDIAKLTGKGVSTVMRIKKEFELD